ncbi:phosphoesterase family protein [Xylophilus ampelinus]|uniref:Phosphoesterase family protein n=1 Tax=Xylophilus ampelinus TaxID=54067 RepID=A0A318SL31_9BURK|nr:phosphoesterase family protein [Xylophilus ampelinus]
MESSHRLLALVTATAATVLPAARHGSDATSCDALLQRDIRTAVVIHADNGGFPDHKAVPAGDAWDPGIRIPTLIVPPRARHGGGDHTQYDTASVLRFITRRWGVETMPGPARPDATRRWSRTAAGRWAT